MKGTCLKGRYLLGEVIGKGGMAVVYKAYDFRSGRTVAVKVLREQYNQDREFVRRFQQEAEAASAISHENLIDIYDVGEQNGARFIVMEYVDGMTLKSLIREHGALDNYTAITIARQICTALQVAHDAHIIHRDIKPQNILLDRKGIAKLADFGIAKTSDTQTITGGGDNGVLGSVHYFSPEQARGEPAGAQSDLYSLGVVLYEMVTARLPFSGDTPVAIALQHMNAQPTPPLEFNRNLTPALNEIILKAIRKDPKDRYQSARDFYDDLSLALVYPEGGFVDGERELAAQENAQDAQNKKRALAVLEGRIRPVRLLLVGLCLLLAGVLAVALLRIGIAHRAQTLAIVPAIQGATMDAAAAQLAEMGLVLQVSGTEFSPDEPGTILQQDPAAESELRSGDAVSVVVSAGPESAEVPYLIGMSLEEARSAIQSLGLQVGEIVHDEGSDLPRNTVLSQDPEEGAVLQNGQSVRLTISDPPLLRSVPYVVGEDLETARSRIEEAGLTVGEVHEESATGVPVGTVFAQSPESGQQMRNGDAVEIWVAQELVMATGTYPLTLEIEQDDSLVTIYLQEDGFYREVSTMNCDRGTLEVELNLESETPGEKTLIVFVNDEEAARDTVTLSVEEDEE
ncbi:MAG: Stk1 family PASTA domain-containing Ser/Thr kinase [Candidatus Spyradocola sp.]